MTTRKISLTVLTFTLALAGASAVLAADPTVVVQPGGSSVVVQPGQPSVTVQPSQPSVTVQPAPPSTVVVPSPQTTVQASDIEATEVHAQTIYANKIKAAMVQGTVHQSDSVKIKDTKGDIKAPSLTAGVTYTATITAPTGAADNIYGQVPQRD